MSLQIDKSDLDYFHILLSESKSKTTITSVETLSTRKRDTDSIKLMEKYVSQVNDSCVFTYQNHHFSAAKSTKLRHGKQFPMSADAKSKFSACNCIQ